jgi:periplasmic copper chaperone A
MMLDGRRRRAGLVGVFTKGTVMRNLILPLAAALALTAASLITSNSYAEDAVPHAMAQDVETGALKITGAWAKAMLPGQPVGGGYLMIENTGAEADRLVSVSSAASPDVQIHEMKMEGDVMKMRRLADGLEIPAGGKVELKPGGYHLMFMAVPEPFKQGGVVKITLKFEKAGEVEVALPVEAANATGPGHMHGG